MWHPNLWSSITFPLKMAQGHYHCSKCPKIPPVKQFFPSMRKNAMSDIDSIFTHKSHLPDDTVFYSIYPDFISTISTAPLHDLHLQILQLITPFTTPYIFQHQPFTLTPEHNPIPNLHGSLRYGDNLDDEWFVVFILVTISQHFPKLSISVHDSDGHFLLIEAAFHLPRWVNPETSTNRVFIRRGRLYILPPSHLPDSPSIATALKFLCENDENPEILLATPDAVQLCLMNKIKEYPEKAEKNMHRVRVRVPIDVGWVLNNEPCLISLAVEGFYDRDVDTMKYADKMERFLPNGKNEEIVIMMVKISRAMYAQLMGQTFRPPKLYPPLPSTSDNEAYKEAELGMKIACGLEMMYQLRKRQGEEGKGSSWEVFVGTLEKSGYFDGLLTGSKEYQRLMKNAEEYYNSSSLHSKASEILSAPVRRVEEILSQPHSADFFKLEELPPTDDDSWFYGGEEELNSALQERQKEMELFYSKQKRKQKVKEDVEEGPSCGNLEEIANSMKQFVHGIASHEGAEVPDNRNMEGIDLELDRFKNGMESAMRNQGFEDPGSDFDLEEGSLSDMDLDDSEDNNESDGDNVKGLHSFMLSYSDALNKELKATTLNKSFIRTKDSTKDKDEGTSKNTTGEKTEEEENEELSPLDVDVNLVKNMLESFSSQQGLPGPASNLLGLMGIRLPQDENKKGH